jgi:DNA-binding NarL/FixJ family response regulator
MAINGSSEKNDSIAIMEHSGEMCDGSSLHQQVINNLKRPRADKLLEDTLANTKPDKCLTKCEINVLRLIVEGNTNKKIAIELHRSERTIEYHRNRLMNKLSANSIVDLVKRAIGMGLL